MSIIKMYSLQKSICDLPLTHWLSPENSKEMVGDSSPKSVVDNNFKYCDFGRKNSNTGFSK